MHIKTLLVSSVILLATSCAKLPVDPNLPQRVVNMPADSVTFAVIGDYGENSSVEEDVANMVKSWNPDFIITTGDNNYTFGAAGTIADNIGKYYSDYIYNPDAPNGQICQGRAANEQVNRFFPSPGNHDHYSAPAMQPYLDYFSLPGDERNYEFTWGPVHFFSLNSGASGKVSYPNSPEAKWFQNVAANATEPFRFAYFHHPPYSVSHHGSSPQMRWPFSSLGINAVFNGHDHVYERVTDKQDSAIMYFVCGNSGKESNYGCNQNPLDANRYSVICDDQNHGAMKVHVTATKAVFEYYTTADRNHPADVYVINK